MESNSSLPPGGWLKVTCGLTTCTPGSAPGPTLGNEYGGTLPFFLLLSISGSNATTTAATTVDQSATIVLIILGVIYGIAAVSVLFIIILPRLIAASTAAAGLTGGGGTTVPAAGMVRRWPPVYGGDVALGQYFVPRQAAQMQHLKRLYAAPNRRFPVVNQVYCYCRVLKCIIIIIIIKA